MLKVKITILEYKTGMYEGNSYANVLARYDGKILKFKLAKDTPDLSKFIDKEVTATISIVAGANMAATIKIDSVA